MATQVNGYQKLLVPQYDTYEHWKNYCLTHGINVDFFTIVLGYGNQCWDVPALLWYQYGLKLETGNGYAYGCYALKRNQNAKFPFSIVGDVNASAMSNKTKIKKGDCLVFAPSGLNYTGHICFADEDYNGTDSIRCLGQNQGQGTGWGIPSNIVNNNLRVFLGGFRNHNWQRPEPAPTPSTKRGNFPFVLYAKKFRNPNL